MINILHALFFWLKCTLVPVARLRRRLHAVPVGVSQREGERQLLVDVSVIIQRDARTGIQRVVRALFLQLQQNMPAGYAVRPVFATRNHAYHYASLDFLERKGEGRQDDVGLPVQVSEGDIFLGLDLAAHLMSRHQSQLVDWRRGGVSIHVLVYDLLPLLHPAWFCDKTVRNFRRWIRTIAICADGLICISEHVRAELEQYLDRRFGLASGSIPIGTIPLGGDLEASAPSKGLPADADGLLASLGSSPTVLMVGTIEPRKGHALVLSAFEALWQQGRSVNLVVVGRPGWKTVRLQGRLRHHPEQKHRLFWLQDVSDEMLGQLYRVAGGLLIASEAEGFGLPLVEAICHKRPILVRDIPVFREVAGAGVNYFAATSTARELADSIDKWVVQFESGLPLVQSRRQYVWSNSLNELIRHLGLVVGTQRQVVAESVHPPHQFEGRRLAAVKTN